MWPHLFLKKTFQLLTVELQFPETVVSNSDLEMESYTYSSMLIL